MLTNADVKNCLERLNKKYQNIQSDITTEEAVANLLRGKSFNGRNEMHKILFDNLNAKVFGNNTNGNLTIEGQSIRIITKKINGQLIPSIVWNTSKGTQIKL